MLYNLIERLKDPSPEVQYQAMDGLIEMASEVRPAMLAIREHYRNCNESEAYSLSTILYRLDPDLFASDQCERRARLERDAARDYAKTLEPIVATAVFETLTVYCKTPPNGKSYDTIMMSRLIAIAIQFPNLIPNLVDVWLLANRPEVVHSLCEIGRERKEVGELVVPLLYSPYPEVVAAAVKIIAAAEYAGQDVAAVVSRLLDLIESRNNDKIPASATSALIGLSQHGHLTEVVEGMTERIFGADGTDPAAYWQLLNGLVRQQSREAINLLVRMFRSKRSEIRCEAVTSCFGVDDKWVVVALCKAAADKQSSIRHFALQALGKVGRNWVNTVLPSLLAALERSNRLDQQDALESMKNMGPDAADAIPALQMKLRTLKVSVDDQLAKAIRATLRVLKAKRAAKSC